MKHTRSKIVITKYKNATVCLVYNEKGTVTDIFCEPDKFKSLTGNIYSGRVVKIVPSLNAAFTEFLPGSEGYFQTGAGSKLIFADPQRVPLPLKCEDRIIVQVKKDAAGTKKPALSCDITLAGRYSVFCAARPGLRFSAKLNNPEKKDEIRERFYGRGKEKDACAGAIKADDSEKSCPDKDNDNLYRQYGFIIRTNAASADTDVIFAEMDYFISLWREILKKAAVCRAPSLLYGSPEAYLSCIRDCADPENVKIITDIPEIYEKINSYTSLFPLNIRSKPELYENKKVPPDLLYGVSRNMEEALDKKVYLKSGGFLVIEPTQALVSIDVNSGHAVSGKDSQAEFLRINIEAAKEAARQIRLRNLSGIIIIDFINMKSPESRDILMRQLKMFLAEDPLKPEAVDVTKLGLVEITRKKSARPLYELADI